ncbi:hypothetical protein GCM10027456_75200 [Kineosporia babensis]
MSADPDQGRGAVGQVEVRAALLDQELQDAVQVEAHRLDAPGGRRGWGRLGGLGYPGRIGDGAAGWLLTGTGCGWLGR